MVGRGALTNPRVFRQIVRGDSLGPELNDYRGVFEGFIERLREYVPERAVTNRMKAFIGWVTKGLHKGHALRRDIYAAKSLPEVRAIFDDDFASVGSKRFPPSDALRVCSRAPSSSL